jgi:hypothetical protein
VKADRDTLVAIARQAAAAYGLDPAMFVAQLAQESGDFAPDVVAGKRRSSAGAIGVAQFMTATAKEFGIDPKDPAQAIPAAAKYMAQLKSRFGTEELARQAYNWGQGNLAKHLADPAKRPMPQETRDYNKHISRRAGVQAPEMDIPVLGQTPRPQVLNLMNAARQPTTPQAPAAAAGSPGLFAMTATSPAAPPATPPTSLFDSPDVEGPDPLGDIFAQANEKAGTLFPAQPEFPSRFDVMIRQMLQRV